MLGPGTAAAAKPVPLTDLFASMLPPLTGGTSRVCATSPLGITVRCVENVTTMPSASFGASGVTFGQWIFCKRACAGSLLTHELVHVRQFEENKWERPAYEAGGGCP